MNNRPRVITLTSEKTRKRRVIHLITQKGERSFKSASANCKQWVIKNGFPFILKVSYGVHETNFGKMEEFTDDMVCNCKEDLEWGLQALVKEYINKKGGGEKL